MKTNRFLKMAWTFAAVLSIMTFLNSCKKTTHYGSNGNLYDNSASVNATIYGQVVKEDGTPVKDAKVRIGSNVYTTDDNGVFYFRNITAAQNATLIEVSKPNYFYAFRTLHLTKNQDHYTRIMMIEMKNATTFNSITGGTIAVNGGGSITFPADALVYKNNGTPYAGTVTAYTKWIDPAGNNLNELTPGALRGIDANNYEKILQTFGMMAVDLFDNAGQALQLSASKTAQLSFPIPASIIANAPNTIPLWYFDMTSGMWKEEGSATKQGNNYVGDVKHFSFWNCDAGGNFVNLEATLQDLSGAPMVNTCVKISNPATGSYSYGWTNSNGYVSGLVPDNAILNLEAIVFPCATSFYSQTVTTTSSAINLGVITVTPPTLNTALISGNVLDCLGMPVSNGMVAINTSNGNVIVQTNSAGLFNATVVLCTFPTAATVTAYDMSTNVNGNSTASLTTGANSLGTLTACGVLNQFINWTSTVGTTTTTTSMVEPISVFNGSFSASSNLTTIYGDDSTSSGGGTTKYINFAFDGLDTTIGAHNLTSYMDYLEPNNPAAPTDPVTLTKYQVVGGFIEGNFSATIIGTTIPLRTVNCSFRVKRN